MMCVYILNLYYYKIVWVIICNECVFVFVVFIAKKTQEVLQFGNQQNRQADTRNYARAEKRRESQQTKHYTHNNIRIINFVPAYPNNRTGRIDC